MNAVTSGFKTLGLLCVSGSLAWGLAACGDAPATLLDDTREVAQALTSYTIASPVQGDCTTTRTIEKVTLPSGDAVIRSTCSETCKKNAYKMGIYNLYTVRPDGSGSAMVDNMGTGPTRSAQVDTPYVPGRYQVSCNSVWQDKQDSTTFFGQSGPAISGDF